MRDLIPFPLIARASECSRTTPDLLMMMHILKASGCAGRPIIPFPSQLKCKRSIPRFSKRTLIETGLEDAITISTPCLMLALRLADLSPPFSASMSRFYAPTHLRKMGGHLESH